MSRSDRRACFGCNGSLVPTAKHLFTKAAADSRFINVGQSAAQATNAASAQNADKLDAMDSTAFLRAKHDSVGVFTIDFGFDGTPCGQHVPIANAEQDGDILSRSSSEVTDCVVVVETFDADGFPLGLIFNLAVMRAAN